MAASLVAVLLILILADMLRSLHRADVARARIRRVVGERENAD